MNPLTAKRKCIELESILDRFGVRANIRATDDGLVVVVKSLADKLLAKRELTARGCRIASIELQEVLCV